MEPTTEVPVGTVVVGYDGSDHSEYALRWAADEADLDGRALTIVTVVNPLSGYELSVLSGGWTPPNDIRKAIWEHAREQLETAKAGLHQSMPDLQVHVLLREGDARQVLLELAENAASLFVGSRGRGALKSLLLGSVSVAVARASACPVFVIRPQEPGHERHGVLVGTDCSEQTRPTLEFAYRQAALRDLPLTVMYCVGGVETMYGLCSVLDDDAVGYDDERRALAEAVSGMGEKFPEVKARLRVAHGVADVCLVQESEHMDLVVVGHHRGKSVGDLVRLGSFVAPVVESAACAVAVAVDRRSS
ncbi:universal stress protein [Methylocystis sp.]|uniref:universal stress protein n=1 Tax=Methylocystis sp. TaxID=1911079 RepID=UPI003DA4DEDB